MALIIFKYCLPTLLGYILFVGISGQLTPFRKPAELVERPAWLLGLWTALAVTLVLSIGLHMAYGMNLSQVQQLLKPTAWLLTGILAPGLIAYFMYSRAIRQEIAAQSAAEKSALELEASNVELIDFDEANDIEDELDEIFSDIGEFEEIAEEEPDLELPVAVSDESYADKAAATFYANDSSIVVDGLPADAELEADIEAALATDIITGTEHMSWAEAPVITQIDDASDWVTGTEHMHWTEQDYATATVVTPAHVTTDEPIEIEELATGTEHMIDPTLIVEMPITGIEHMDSPELIVEAIEIEEVIATPTPMVRTVSKMIINEPRRSPELDVVEQNTEDSIPALTIDADRVVTEAAVEHNPELAAEVELMRRSLATEVALREETEKHLRITRKGLSALESENHQFELEKADAVIKAEEKLETQIKRTSKSEAHAARVEKQKKALETQMLELKTSVVEAKREIRQSTAARAKALTTANKSVAFAQQAMKERAVMEAKLKDAEAALNKRQETISSLISALEKEKLRTQNEISSMAKQLVLHEKQLQARRSIEQASRSADGLSTRLVKKVAKGASKSAA